MTDPDVCRVCRSGATIEKPLYHPCKCSGSIRFIHQECLLEWLSHCKKSLCELCNHPFVFGPVYQEDMPTHLPTQLILHQGWKQCRSIVTKGLRLISVLFVWLLAVPWVIFHSWHFFNPTPHLVNNNDHLFWQWTVECIKGHCILATAFSLILAVVLFKHWVSQHLPEPSRGQQQNSDQHENLYNHHTHNIDVPIIPNLEPTTVSGCHTNHPPTSSLPTPSTSTSTVDHNTPFDDDSDDDDHLVQTTMHSLMKKPVKTLPRKTPPQHAPDLTGFGISHRVDQPASPELAYGHLMLLPLSQPLPARHHDPWQGLCKAIGWTGSPWIIVQNAILFCTLAFCPLGLASSLPLAFGQWSWMQISPASLIQSSFGWRQQHDLVQRWLGLVTDRWHRLVLDQQPLNKAACLFAGYCLCLCLWFLYTHLPCLQPQELTRQDPPSPHQASFQHHEVDESAATSLQRWLHQHVTHALVFLLVVFDSIVLPGLYGYGFHWVAQPYLSTSSFPPGWPDRVAHWGLGLTWMTALSHILSSLSSLLRPGVLGFLHDPQRHPVRDILSQPLPLLCQKLLLSALVHLGLLVFGVGAVVTVLKDIAHLQLDFNFSPPPLTLVALHGGMLLVMTSWWPGRLVSPLFSCMQSLASSLQLSSSLFGHASQQPTDRDDRQNDDGYFTRVSDSHAFGSQHDPLHSDVSKTGTLVYMPGHFSLRILAFLSTLWILMTSVICLAIWMPIHLGRAVVDHRWLPNAGWMMRDDLQKWAMGIYCLYWTWLAVVWFPPAVSGSFSISLANKAGFWKLWLAKVTKNGHELGKKKSVLKCPCFIRCLDWSI
ncbi:hypothetical protein DM01DRAFT_1024316 [Hesseltinella vesiculosa]|uniref:RING-type E3 ubiquitin transferase n=1 Tax=Hesseltinella vesiculosa TaxID=101127 RepID=A0A1X2GK86_9FUNG|nr:hypothetical protein DM01DRAFT_1024316 [Hesseltinella vesiculosa]